MSNQNAEVVPAPTYSDINGEVMCDTCGAWIGSSSLHNAWHAELAQAGRVAPEAGA